MGTRVLVIGAGGLGSSVLPLLAQAGVPLTVLDDDVVSLSNLQRQLLYRTEDVGRSKAEAAAARLRAMVPGADVEARLERLAPENAFVLARDARLVVDGSDNFATRFLANDACVLAGTSLVHGGILRFTGQVLTVVPMAGGCYRCLFEAPPPEGSVPSCAEAGVLGALCGVVGAWMAEAALRLLAGKAPAQGLLVYDALDARVRRVGLGRDRACAVCGDAPTIRDLDPAHYAAPGCAA
ncbi:HesA/MoeB/ThiF family protein [Vulgatibacter sp.]|uniref:HesA/MoeB/ThiF family protein n=1 Tax=Vulgatibacter sp. TaxID=1971226 RepID=UPI003567D8A5